MASNLRPRSGTEVNLGQFTIPPTQQPNAFANIQFPQVQPNAFTNMFPPVQPNIFSFTQQPPQGQPQQPIVPFLQPSQQEIEFIVKIVKAEIQKHFNGVEIFMENDVVSRFGSYMTGIDLCVIHNNKLIAIHLKQTSVKTNIKDLSHFVFCANRIITVNPHFRLYMISTSKTPPTKLSVDLMNDCKIFSVVSGEQQTFLNQLMHTIHNILIDQSSPMDICK